MGKRGSSVWEAHAIYLKYHCHADSYLDDNADDSKKEAIIPEHEAVSMATATAAPTFSMFHKVQKTGVIYATSRATSHGFTAESSEWANMGQGAPETGPIPNSPPRDFTMRIEDAELEYAPVTGLYELRAKVAAYYNHIYRRDKASQYQAENVCIVPGGRAGISRIMVRDQV